MKTEEYLNKLKKIYSQTHPSSKLTTDGWGDLHNILDPRPWTRIFSPRNFLYAFSSLILVAGVLLGIVQASQAALPGDILYPVKRFTEKIITSITGNNKKQLENRAAEIIDLNKKRDEETKRLEQVIQQYKQTVQETDGKIEKDKNSEQQPEKKQEEQIRTIQNELRDESKTNQIQDNNKPAQPSGDQNEVDQKKNKN